MTLIKELIEIPTAVHRGDFVLKLTEGVDRPAKDGGRLRRHQPVSEVFRGRDGLHP